MTPSYAFFVINFVGIGVLSSFLAPNRIIPADDSIIKLQAKATVKDGFSPICSRGLTYAWFVLLPPPPASR